MQKLLQLLYADLDKEEKRIEALQIPDYQNMTNCYRKLFATLYRDHNPLSGAGRGRVRLVGPVGERPIHVCFLLAEGMEPRAREGLLQAARWYL